MEKVYTIKTKKLGDDIRKIIELLGIKKDVPKGSKIFIKINLSLDRNYPATNTSADFLYHLVRQLSRNYEVLAGDSNPSSCNADKALKATKTGQAIIKGGGTPVNLSRDRLCSAKNKECTTLKQTMMPQSVIKADCVISLALLKTHVFTTVTGTIKNMFGCYPGLKILHHPYLNDAIHDAVKLTKPAYAIIDGRVGMQGRGPVEGTPVETGVILASTHLGACDAEAAKIMGFKPEKIEHIQKIGIPKYKVIGPTVRMKYKQADKGIIDKLQELSLKNKLLIKMCYKTPLFNIIKTTAKTIKDIKRYLKA